MTGGPGHTLSPGGGHSTHDDGLIAGLPTFACDLFPLPRPPPLKMAAGLSRRSSQRLARKVRIQDDLRELISSLNWMHFGDFDVQPSCAASPLQEEVLCRLESLVRQAGDLGHQCRLPSQEAALAELLRGQDGYAEPSTPASLAPFNLELISLPKDLSDAPRAEDLLQGDDRRYLEVQERMLRGNQDEGLDDPIRPYWDPALKHNPRNYRRFIQKLHGIQYLEYTLEPSQFAGVFFVWKSDRERIRMIIDARPANRSFLDPPGISLATAETFAKFEVEPVDGQFPDGFNLFAGLSDVKDCFHRIKQPRWLAKHFCLLPIEARHVGLTGHSLDGRVLKSNDLVYPMPGSLCMGFSWSLFFAQRINEAVMENVPSLQHSSLVHDRGGPAVFLPHSHRQMKHFVYVDNLGVLSANREAVEEGLADLSDDFTSKNLLLHPGELQHNPIKALGIQLDGSNLTSKVAPDRLHRVRQGLRCILHRGRCTGRVLEILVGHCTYCGLMNRCCLSIFHSVYKFIKSSYFVSAPLWSSVRSELRAFAGLMPLLRSDWCRPWSGVVAVSDASEEGFGVCGAVFDPKVVASVGRTTERDRFRRVGAHSAREAALTSAGFIKNEVTGKWLEGALDDEDYLHQSGWSLNQEFPEVPKDFFHPHIWSTARQGAWKRREHIVHLEAWALVKSFEFIVSDIHTCNARQLFLVDSMSAALAFDRCRSKNFKMLRCIRRFCSLALARNISFAVRWVPSELNPADEPSRDPSKQVTVSPFCQSFSNGPEAAGCAQPSNVLQQFETTEQSFGTGRHCGWKGAETKQDFESARSLSPTPEAASVFQPQLGRPDWNSAVPVLEAGPADSRQSDGVFKFKLRVREGQHQISAAPEAEQKQAQKVCDRDFGRHLSGPQLAGEESHWGQISSILLPGVCGPPGLCHLQKPPNDRGGHGLSTEPVFQPPFSSRAPRPPGRQDLGVCDASPAKVWTPWHLEAASCLESSERLETSSPWVLQKGFPTGSVGCNLLRDEAASELADGAFHYDWPVSLHPTWGASEVHGLQFGETFPNYHRILDPLAEPRGAPRAVEGGRVRRQRRTRLSLFETLGFSSDEAAGEPKQGAAPVELRLWPLLQSLPASHGLLGLGGPDPVSDASQWAVHRQEPQPEVSGRGSEKGPLEKPQKCGQIRKECSPGSKLPSLVTRAAAPLPPRRATARGCDVGPGPRPKTAFKAKGLKGQYVADLFAGSGGVAKACRQLGFSAKEWEIARGCQFDLTHPSVLKRIKYDVDQLLVLAAMLAPPFSSFSVARDRTAAIRTRQFPWGLPDDQLLDTDRTKIQQGNQCFKAAIRIISWLDTHHIPWILENPATSKCWYLPPLQKLESSPHVVAVFTDFCQYGCRWRKRTKLLCGNLDTQDLHRLQRLCTGQELCSQTHKPHFRLTGSNHQGIPWTHIAQPYPTGLCRDLAFALTSPAHYNPPLL